MAKKAALAAKCTNVWAPHANRAKRASWPVCGRPLHRALCTFRCATLLSTAAERNLTSLRQLLSRGSMRLSAIRCQLLVKMRVPMRQFSLFLLANIILSAAAFAAIREEVPVAQPFYGKAPGEQSSGIIASNDNT